MGELTSLRRRGRWTLGGLVVLALLLVVAVTTWSPGAPPPAESSLADVQAPTSGPSVSAPPTTPPSGDATPPVRKPPGKRAVDPLDKLRKKAAALARRTERVEAAVPPLVLRIGSFNILGSQHTGPGGNKGPSWPGAAARLPGAVERIAAHQLSIVGLQEAQPDQLAALTARTGFATFPGPEAGALARVNAIMYDPALYDVLSAQTFSMSNGRGFRPQPVMLLRDKATQREFYVVNTHPPAGFDAATTAKRAAGQRQLVDVMGQLAATGRPALLTGDMNDRQAFVARVLGPAKLVTARAGLAALGPMPVDWIAGTPDVVFSDYIRDASTIARRISDHFLISATATIGADAP